MQQSQTILSGPGERIRERQSRHASPVRFLALEEHANVVGEHRRLIQEDGPLGDAETEFCVSSSQFCPASDIMGNLERRGDAPLLGQLGRPALSLHWDSVVNQEGEMHRALPNEHE